MVPASPDPRSAVVVGGGPAGLMAAETLAGAGLVVTVYEHKPSVGRKFLLAGRGGLNVTHSEPADRFAARYGDVPPQLRSALEHFSPDDLRSWSASLGEETFVGSSGRVFPSSFRATPLLRAWMRRLDALGVVVRARHRWVGLGAVGDDGRRSLAFRDAEDREVTDSADVTVLAVGGASWPRVGSDGAWVGRLESHGVAVTPLTAANCGVRIDWSGELRERFAGQPLKNVAVSGGDEIVRGDVVVTETGLEGGPVYAIGPSMRAQLAAGSSAVLHLDLQPDLDVDRLEARLARRRPKESTSTWLRRAGFGPLAISMLREVSDNRLPAEARSLAELAKAVPLTVDAMMPIDRAISTAGGVAFAEIDETFMLRRAPGVFVAGEMLDWEAPTGGYLLQACFSTGVAAARGAIAWR